MAALRFIISLFALATASLCGLAQDNPYLGKWDISGVGPHSNYVYWLEVKMEDGKLAGYFLNQSGSVLKLAEIKLDNGELVFRPAGSNNPNAPKPPEHRAHLNEDKDKLLGMVTVRGEQVAWLGVPAPKWGNYDARVYYWVRDSVKAQGIEDQLGAFLRNWLREKWPFHQLVFPGRDISWQEWQTLKSSVT